MCTVSWGQADSSDGAMAAMATDPPVATLRAHGFPVGSATVYADRADVVRSVAASLKAGLSRIALIGVGPLDPSTLRVSGVGKATIVDVQFETERKLAADANSDAESQPNTDTDAGATASGRETRRHEAARELRQLQLKKKRIDIERESLLKNKTLVSEFASNVLTRPPASVAAATSSSSGSAQAWNNQVTGFFGQHVDQHRAALSGIHLALVDASNNAKDIESKIKAKENELRHLDSNGNHTQTWTDQRTISVLVSAPEDNSDVEITIAYVVHQASWKPSYDIRVDSDAQTFELTYMAELSQQSMETWKDAKLTLSTAKPAVSGDIPRFESPWVVQLAKVDNAIQSNQNQGHDIIFKKRKGMAFGAMGMAASGAGLMAGQDDGSDYSDAGPPDMQPAIAHATENATSATFEIAERATVPADGQPHKVTVAVLSFTPTFGYAAVPKLAAHAYLRAIIRNESDYPLLPGPCAIYLDGNFVAKSSIGKLVSSYDTFNVSLGVDPGIVVTYPSTQKQISETGSTLLGTCGGLHRYTQCISVKNSKHVGVSMVVTEQVPMSEDERIKVTLIEPSPTSIVTVPNLSMREHSIAPVATAAAIMGAAVSGAASSNAPVSSDSASAVSVPTSTIPPAHPICMFQDTGIIDYRMEIPAGETRDIRLRYDVSFPQKEEIVGL